jgi:hypothetical protein
MSDLPLHDNSTKSLAGREISSVTAQDLLDTNLYVTVVSAPDREAAMRLKASVCALPIFRIKPGCYTIMENLCVIVEAVYSSEDGMEKIEIEVVLRPVIHMVQWGASHDPALSMILDQERYVITGSPSGDSLHHGQMLRVMHMMRAGPISDMLSCEVDVRLDGDPKVYRFLLIPSVAYARKLSRVYATIFMTQSIALQSALIGGQSPAES